MTMRGSGTSIRGSIALGCLAAFACNDAGSSARDAGLDSSPATAADSGNATPPFADASAPDAGDAAPIGGGDAGAPGSVLAAWRRRVIYLAVPDRFSNGDPSNDSLGNPGCFDPADPSKIHGGDLAGLRARLPYLVDLGVSAVWILPQYKQSPGRCGYHGYWPDFVDPNDGAIEKTMGTDADLAALVTDLHAAGMRFILDMVVNHSGVGARIVAQHPDWFHDSTTCAQLGDPDVNCPIGGDPLPDFAQEKPEVATYLTTTCLSWTARFAIDGIRMDTVKNVGLPYWKAWNPAMRASSPNLFTVGEVFDEGAATTLAPYLDAGFSSLFNYPLFNALNVTFAAGGSVDNVADKVKEEIAVFGQERMSMMTSFIDNHDNPRFTSAVPGGTAEDEIRRRQHLALAAIFTLPGIPQLYYGDELALYGGKDPDNRRDMPTWAWTSADRAGTHAGAALPNAQTTFAFVQKLIAIRSAHPALYEGPYVEMWRQGGGVANLLAFFRGSGTDRAIVVLNAGAAATVSLPVQTNHAITASDRAALVDGSTLDDLLDEGGPATATIAGGRLAITMPAGAIGIYRARP